MAGEALGRNGIILAIFRGIGQAFRAVARAVRQLFLETMGLFFSLFVVIGVFAAYREYQAYDAGRVGIERAGIALAFTGVFAYFACTSFLRARK
jgi:hypothetical protein